MFVSQLINAVSTGAAYALFALGLALIFGVLRVIQFAHGAVLLGGAYATWFLVDADMPLPLALGGAVIVGMALSLLIEVAVIRPLAASDGASNALPVAIATIGVEIAALALFRAVLGNEARGLNLEFGQATLSLGGINMRVIDLITILLAGVVLLGTQLMLDRSRHGWAIRAVAESPRIASLLGIPHGQVIRATFLAAGAFAGLSGALLAISSNVASPSLANAMLLKAIAIIVIGGMGSPAGALIGAFLIAGVETWTSVVIGSSYRDFAAFVLVVVMLVWRPSGLFGSDESIRA